MRIWRSATLLYDRMTTMSELVTELELSRIKEEFESESKQLLTSVQAEKQRQSAILQARLDARRAKRRGAPTASVTPSTSQPCGDSSSVPPNPGSVPSPVDASISTPTTTSASASASTSAFASPSAFPVLRVATWNVLAEAYSGSSHSHTTCPRDALAWASRFPRIIDVVRRLCAGPLQVDVLCLQEVDKAHAPSFITALDAAGYACTYEQRPGGRMDGLLVPTDATGLTSSRPTLFPWTICVVTGSGAPPWIRRGSRSTTSPSPSRSSSLLLAS